MAVVSDSALSPKILKIQGGGDAPPPEYALVICRENNLINFTSLNFLWLFAYGSSPNRQISAIVPLCISKMYILCFNVLLVSLHKLQ